MSELPTVFSYLDHRAYLRDWFAAKREANPRYSHRMFSGRAGFKSPSLLHLVIKGDRNITDKSFPGFCKALGLGGEERSFFKLLVQLDRSKTPKERNAIHARLRAKQRFEAADDIESAGFDYLSDWTLPAIRELAGAPGFRMDASWVAKTLSPRITVPRARKALEKLVAMGLLEPDDRGGAVQKDATVVTAHEVAGLAVFNYHRAMIGLASEALESSPADLRHFGAVTVRVSPDLLGKLKEEVAAFQERVLELCDDVPEADRVMQLNIQLFPLTKRVSETS